MGDIVGKAGKEVCKLFLNENKSKYDFIFANGENTTGGRGINAVDSDFLFSLGIKSLTMGNHTWDNREFQKIASDNKFVRPANYPVGTPGKGYRIYSFKNKKIGVINLLGNIFLEPVVSPFHIIDKIVTEIQKETKIIFVDIHAEATSEKRALAYYLTKKVSAVMGTHTHIQTADEQIFGEHTGYITDVGMCGSNDSVLGIKKDIAIKKFLTQLPVKFETAEDDLMVNAVELEVDEETGKCISIRRINEKVI